MTIPIRNLKVKMGGGRWLGNELGYRYTSTGIHSLKTIKNENGIKI